jgi:hypothetical protein
MKLANGAITIAEAYKACEEKMMGWKKVITKVSNITPQYFLTCIIKRFC